MLNDHNDAPIALFDSGIGGLSVLRHVRERLPAEELIYLADSAHTPYGDKSEDFIIERSLTIGRFFIEQGAKVLVIACNSATAAAVSVMREQLDIPIVGMEPGIKPAVTQSKNRRVGIMATAATVASEKFSTLAQRYANEGELSIQACPGLVEHIEAMTHDSEESYQLLASYLLPFQQQGIDTLALGCTHYPFMLPQIREILGDDVAVIDTGPAVAEQLQRILKKSASLREQTAKGNVQFYATQHTERLGEQIEKLWG
ncbi:MAG: glutamate racemase, partial [Gammaproteobacteria bacterium]|nr:glutamate racemase [Gammaproteobacteria bacterium]